VVERMMAIFGLVTVRSLQDSSHDWRAHCSVAPQHGRNHAS
jgi:hypothetical protein